MKLALPKLRFSTCPYSIHNASASLLEHHFATYDIAWSFSKRVVLPISFTLSKDFQTLHGSGSREYYAGYEAYAFILLHPLHLRFHMLSHME